MADAPPALRQTTLDEYGGSADATGADGAVLVGDVGETVQRRDRDVAEAVASLRAVED
jgi:hypothetical protein